MEWGKRSRDSRSRRTGSTRSVSEMSVWVYSRVIMAPSNEFPSRGTINRYLFVPIDTSRHFYRYLQCLFFIPSHCPLMSLIWIFHFEIILISLPDSFDLILPYHTLPGSSFTTMSCHRPKAP